MKRFVCTFARIVVLGIVILSLLVLSRLSSPTRVHAASPLPNMGKQAAAAFLGHTATGSAQLDWSSAHDVLTVTLYVSGLQAKSVHVAHIHAGDCHVDGAIIYPLNDVVANAAGNAVSTTVINNVNGGIPALGWYINVHVGASLATPEQAAALACGTIINTSVGASVQSTVTTLGVTPSPNQSAYGASVLTLKGKTLTVYTTVYHLVPGSMHMEHIHAGSCQYQVPGNVLYPLTELVANAKGVAIASTTIRDITAIPLAGWYINIHYGTDLSTQVGYDPIDCGNVNVIY